MIALFELRVGLSVGAEAATAFLHDLLVLVLVARHELASDDHSVARVLLMLLLHIHVSHVYSFL